MLFSYADGALLWPQLPLGESMMESNLLSRKEKSTMIYLFMPTICCYRVRPLSCVFMGQRTNGGLNKAEGFVPQLIN